MKIIQISDLHVTENTKELPDCAKELLKKAIEVIEPSEPVVLCVCGDIIDKGSKGNSTKKYNNAAVILREIQGIITQVNCDLKTVVVPGNHDICKKKGLCKKNEPPFSGFVEFACNVTGENVYKQFINQDVISVDYYGINWILCNSAHLSDRTFGDVDIPQLKELINDHQPSVIVMHHTLLSNSGNDNSVLRNGYDLVDTSKKGVLAILHGHIHGLQTITIDSKCRVIGVGSLLKDIMNVNKQLNVIDISMYNLYSASNYIWAGDQNHSVSCRDQFFGDDIINTSSDVLTLYHQVMDKAKAFSSRTEDRMRNTVIRYHGCYKSFCTQIESKAFQNYLEDAKLWQADGCPNILYYNHGSVIKAKDSYQYIVNLLNRNPTSRRAIITLINQDMVQDSGDDYLPSFDLIQFSFSNNRRNTLNVSLYMRSLEVSRFLPVNICEVYLLLKKLERDNIVSDEIDITIFAHSAAYIDRFSCFKKTALDITTEDDLIALIGGKNYNALYEMVKEKSETVETVINTEGLQKLKNALKRNGKKSYAKHVDNVLTIILTIKDLRESHSDLFMIKAEDTRKLESAYEKLLKDFLH